LLAVISASPLAAQPAACPVRHNVGFRILQAAGTKIAVWYPSSAVESVFTYPGRNAVIGSVVRDGPVSNCDRFPLIVYSHGYGGCGTQSVFFTEQVARNGYIVAAPDHRDARCAVDGSGAGNGDVSQDPFRNPETWTDQSFQDRRDDIRNVLNLMLAHSDFGPAIDPERIGGAGHSLGGYTIFGMLGGWTSWKDARLKAGLLLSPYVDPFRVQNLIPRVTLPVMFQSGDLDFLIRRAIEGSDGAFEKSNTPKFFPVMDRAGHLAWTNSSCSNVAVCNSSSDLVRAINGYAFGFLDLYLKNAESVPALWSRLTGVDSYRRNIPFQAVSSASYEPVSLPADAIGSGFAAGGLAQGTIAADRLPLPETMGGTTVTITDSTGVSRRAQIYFVSGNQINFLMPRGTAPGEAKIVVRDAVDTIASGTTVVEPVWPTFFTARRDGKGAPAAELLTVWPDGSRRNGFPFDPNNPLFPPVPIDVLEGEQYLILYGTGFRSASAGEASAMIGSTPVPVFGLAAQPTYEGLDQIALGPLPQSLAGAGLQEVRVTIRGRTSNVVTIRLK
jgi:uncharacterized protein (TIGR03437 family)